MKIEIFIGLWENSDGNILKIEPNNKISLKVTFISGKTGKPIIREYYKGKKSVEMYAEFDSRESNLDVDLWEKGRYFKLSLAYDWIEFNVEPGYRLAPSLIENAGDDLTERYGDLFMSLDYYKRIEK